MKKMWSGRARRVSWLSSLFAEPAKMVQPERPRLPKDVSAIVDRIVDAVGGGEKQLVRDVVSEIVATERAYMASAVDMTENESALARRVRSFDAAHVRQGVEDRAREWPRELAALLRTIMAAEEMPSGDGIRVKVPRISQVHDARALIDSVVTTILSWSSAGADLSFGGLLAQHVKQKLLKASNLTHEGADQRPDKIAWPRDAKGSGSELVERYLAGTPLATLLMTDVEMVISTKEFFTGAWIVGRSGSGKTQLLENFIVQMLKLPVNPSLVLVDSQGELLDRVSRLAIFADGKLAGKLVYIDPKDTQSVSLNPFALRRPGGGGAISEQLENSVVDLLTYLLDGILGSGLTNKQSLSFVFLIRLLLSMPPGEASIATLLEVLKDPSRYQRHINRLDGRDKEFFDRVFFAKNNAGTREQIERRLWELLSHRTFERMLSGSDAKLDFFAELNRGAVICADTSKQFLGETRSAIMGRLILTLTLRAIFQRALVPASQRRPVFVIVDEAHDVLGEDVSAQQFAAQARKMNASLWAAHQSISQLSPDVRRAFVANMGVKLFGGLSDSEARDVAEDLRVAPSFLTGLKRGKGSATFALHVSNRMSSAVPISVPLGSLDREQRMSATEYARVRENIRQKYGSSNRAAPTRTLSPLRGTPSKPVPDDDDNWRS